MNANLKNGFFLSILEVISMQTNASKKFEFSFYFINM